MSSGNGPDVSDGRQYGHLGLSPAGIHELPGPYVEHTGLHCGLREGPEGMTMDRPQEAQVLESVMPRDQGCRECLVRAYSGGYRANSQEIHSK